MQRKFQVLITFGILIFLIAGLYIFTNWFSILTGYFTGESEQAKLAQCLRESGAEFYTSVSCADCEKQEELFGESFKLISSIDCGNNKELCPNLREIPAWYINKNVHYGLKALNELKELSGCTV
jgi:ribosomal protein S27E